MLYKTITREQKNISIYVSGNPSGRNMHYENNRIYFMALSGKTFYPIDGDTYQYFTNDPFYDIVENLKKGKYAILIENLVNEAFAYN